MAWMRVMGVIALSTAAAATPASDPVEGVIVTDAGRAELLTGRLPAGKRVELPEGWLEVEEDGPEEGGVGSFTVEPSGQGTAAPSTAALAVAEAPPGAGPATASAPAPSAAARACRQERSAYLRQLWKESGIEVEDPEALIDGLDAGTSGPGTAFYWFALQADPFRNLAWSSELQSRARDLARCIRENRARAP